MEIFDVISQPYRAAASVLKSATGWYGRRQEAAERKRQDEQAHQKYIIDQRKKWSDFAASQTKLKEERKLTPQACIEASPAAVTHPLSPVSLYPIHQSPVSPPSPQSTLSALADYSKHAGEGKALPGEHARLQRILWESACLTSAPAAVAQDHNDIAVHKSTLEQVIKTETPPLEQRAPLLSAITRQGKDIAAHAIVFGAGALTYTSIVAHYYQQGTQEFLSSYGINGNVASAVRSLPQWAAYSADLASSFSQSLALGLAAVPVALAGIALASVHAYEKAYDDQLLHSKQLASQGLDAAREAVSAVAHYRDHASPADSSAALAPSHPIDICRLDKLSDSVQAAVDAAAATTHYRPAAHEHPSPVLHRRKEPYISALRLRVQNVLAGGYSACASLCRTSVSVLL